MSYKSLVNNNVNKAFKTVGDLAETVTLVKKVSSTFNFGTGLVTEQEATNIVTKAIIVESKKQSKDRKVTNKVIWFRTADVGDVSMLEKVIINTKEWKLGPIISTNGYTTLIEAYREV